MTDSRAVEGSLPWRDMFAGRLGRVTVGILLMETLFAIQSLVTITVLPAVVTDLGGIRLYGVALSASVLAGAVVLPVAARIARRVGALATFVASVLVFAGGTVIVVTAVNMPVFVLGRLIEGAGGGAQYAVALAVAARVYSERQRPRLLALWTAAWALPGLLGPSYGGLVASSLGWRWAFGLLLPFLLVAALLIAPALTGSAARSADAPESAEPVEAESPESPESAEPADVSTGWLVTLGIGAGLVLLAMGAANAWATTLGVVGGVAAVVAVRAILPAGTFRARRGLPSTVAVAFLATTAFFAADGFLPVILTRLRGRSLTEASIVITCATLAWVAGSFLQVRLVSRVQRRVLVAGGSAMLVAGIVGVAAGATGAPLVVPYLAWTLAGFGMGWVYPTITLVAMESAPARPAAQVETLAQYQLADSLGAAVGPGLAGGVLSLGLGLGASLRSGLLAGLALALVIALVLLAAAVTRFDRAPAQP